MTGGSVRVGRNTSDALELPRFATTWAFDESEARGQDARERFGDLRSALTETAPMDSSLDLTNAVARLRALIDDDPRAALERASDADPLRVAELARHDVRAHGALVLADAVVVGTYARLLAPGGLAELSHESLQAHVSAALAIEQRAPFAPEILAALERALGCSMIHAARAAELIVELDERRRATFLSHLRRRSQALAQLWPMDPPAGTEFDELHTPADFTNLLREILASAFRG